MQLFLDNITQGITSYFHSETGDQNEQSNLTQIILPILISISAILVAASCCLKRKDTTVLNQDPQRGGPSQRGRGGHAPDVGRDSPSTRGGHSSIGGRGGHAPDVGRGSPSTRGGHTSIGDRSSLAPRGSRGGHIPGSDRGGHSPRGGRGWAAPESSWW